MKKIIFMLTLFLFCFSVVGCGKTEERYRDLQIESTDVALLTIVSDNGDDETNFLTKYYGHAFLAITNIKSQEFVVGDRKVAPNETITFGLWPIQEHFGVWFNVESNYINEYNKYAQRVSLTIGVDLEDIEKICTIIDNNNKWTLFYNCSDFACEIWNSVAEEFEKLNVNNFVSPNDLVKEIKLFKNYEFNKVFNTNDVVTYYKEA